MKVVQGVLGSKRAFIKQFYCMTYNFTRNIVSVAAAGTLVLAAGLSTVLAAAPASTATVVIDTVNGVPPTGFCVAGPVVIVGHGITDQQGSTHALEIGWGDGTASTTIGSLAGHSTAFNFTASHSFEAQSTGITFFLYHQTQAGKDGVATILSQCVAPPTQGVVILAKNVVNDNAVQTGNAVASNFTLTIDGQDFVGSPTGATPGALLDEGTYPITETGPAGYDRTSTTCVDTDTDQTVSTNGSITVVKGHNYLCTVTNNDAEPVFGTLKVIKEVTGSNALASAFTLTVKDVNDAIVGSAVGSAIGTEYNLVVGTYTVSEAANPHYEAAFSGACNSNGVVTLANGTSECTVTNTYHNSAPIAISDAYSTDEDVTLTVDEAAGVLVNDSDPEGDSMVAAIATEPTKGTVTLNGNGSFEYVPDADANGIDTFTYTAYDGVDETTEVEVTITINPVNDAPVAQNDADNTNEDTAVTTDDVRGNDSDVDGDPLIVSAFDAASVEGGTVVNNGDGTFTYTPPANFGGSDSFTYTISDGSLEDTATVTIEVSSQNDAPVAVADVYNTDEDTTLTKDAAAGVLDNDHDTDGGVLKAVLDTNVANGTLTLNEDGSFEYVPEANYAGPVSFTYHVEDESGASSNEVTVTITVNAVNDAPTADDQTIATGINTAYNAGAVVGHDIDGDSLTFAVASSTAHGVLEFLSNGLFSYTPAVNFTGSDFFTFFANDGDEDSNVATVTIDVSGDPENTLDLCKDGVDNDNDEDVDLDDSDCAPFIPHLTLTKLVNNGEQGEAESSDWTLIASSTSMVISGKTGDESVTNAVVDPGTYTISEEGPSRYSSWLSCTKDGETTMEGGSQISIEIGDTNVRCTITNTFTEYASDLSVTKSVDDSTPNANQTIVYTITVANAGPDAATNVTVSDLLPAGVSFVSASASQGSYVAGTGLWTVGALAAGGEGSSATLSITAQVTADSEETVSNTASASSSNEDGNSSNNSQAVSFTVERSGSNSTSGSRPQGSVLGASTGRVLGETCGLYMDQYLKRALPNKNNSVQVTKLQDFLVKHGYGSFTPTGFFGPLTEAAVKAFQAKYADEVLKPWNLPAPTGLAYLTTLRQVNLIECPDLMIPVPTLVPWSSNPNAQ
jgi:uncharacterized repeat protein (TIGR01451 family)